MLKLYYTRLTYTITIDLNDGSDPDTINILFEETISIDEPIRTGYDFAQWEIVEPEDLTTIPTTMPAYDFTLKPFGIRQKWITRLNTTNKTWMVHIP